jgi:hypothetical protein
MFDGAAASLPFSGFFSAVATPELQARVCMPRVDVPDLFLFVAKMAIICRKMWKKWAIL